MKPNKQKKQQPELREIWCFFIRHLYFKVYVMTYVHQIG